MLRKTIEGASESKPPDRLLWGRQLWANPPRPCRKTRFRASPRAIFRASPGACLGNPCFAPVTCFPYDAVVHAYHTGFLQEEQGSLQAEGVGEQFSGGVGEF